MNSVVAIFDAFVLQLTRSGSLSITSQLYVSSPAPELPNHTFSRPPFVQWPPLCPDSLSCLTAALQEHGFLSFFELLEAPHKFTADFLNQAIADNLVATDLDRESLA